jgi:hypothetical protein
VLVVVPAARDVAVAGVRCAIELVPVAAKIDPAVEARAGAVVSKLSRTLEFHCAAVRAELVTAVNGTDQAISGITSQ